MIRVHIERLVVEGLPVSRADAARLRTEFERELTRRLASGGLHPQLRGGGAVDAVRGGEMRVERSPAARKLGAQVAGAVYEGIGR